MVEFDDDTMFSVHGGLSFSCSVFTSRTSTSFRFASAFSVLPESVLLRAFQGRVLEEGFQDVNRQYCDRSLSSPKFHGPSGPEQSQRPATTTADPRTGR